MIKLSNISNNQTVISVNVESYETNPIQKYQLVFDVNTQKFKASIPEPDIFDVSLFKYNQNKS